MLYLIGLGLGDTSDITVKGLEISHKCKRLYCDKDNIKLWSENEKDFYGSPIFPFEASEENYQSLYKESESQDVALLVPGDPLVDSNTRLLACEGREKGFQIKVIHNSCIFNAVGSCGLSLYNFGATLVIPSMKTDSFSNDFFDGILQNYSHGLHTLCLLEKNLQIEDGCRSAFNAARQILQIIQSRNLSSMESLTVILLARVGMESQLIKCISLDSVSNNIFELGNPPYYLIIVGETSEVEKEALAYYSS